jgi:UV excision repair protein RAD23
MKLTFKDLKQQKFTIEAEPTDTISQLKEKIFKHKGEEKEWDPSLQKLIFSGKILADDKTIEFYKVEEKGFMVCMLAKPKPVSISPTPTKPPATPAQSSKIATPAAPAAPAPAPANSSSAPIVPATPSPAGASASASFNDLSVLALGAPRSEAIENMIAMGFQRDQIELAMQAAFLNPDRAVDYLLNGIPEHLQTTNNPAPAANFHDAGSTDTAASSVPPIQHPPGSDNVNLFEAAAAAAARRAPGAGAGGQEARNLLQLDFLRNNPQFQQLRRLVQESPQMLEPILQQVGTGNPQLAALISQNPDAFLHLLSEEDEPNLQTISVTPEEAEAINRLCELGFNRDQVIHAYIACDKNEELTANYLFDNPDDDDEMEP